MNKISIFTIERPVSVEFMDFMYRRPSVMATSNLIPVFYGHVVYGLVEEKFFGPAVDNVSRSFALTTKWGFHVLGRPGCTLLEGPPSCESG